MPLIIAARGTEQWQAGEWGEGEVREQGEKKRQGAPVCKPDTLAVTVNKLTERKTDRHRELRVRKRGSHERGHKKGRTCRVIKSDGEMDGKNREKEGEEKKTSSSIQGQQGFTFA